MRRCWSNCVLSFLLLVLSLDKNAKLEEIDVYLVFFRVIAKSNKLLTHLEERPWIGSTRFCMMIQLVHIYINRINKRCRCQQNIKPSLTFLSQFLLQNSGTHSNPYSWWPWWNLLKFHQSELLCIKFRFNLKDIMWQKKKILINKHSEYWKVAKARLVMRV